MSSRLGVPIARATAHVRTLHPEFRGATRIWRRGESIEIRTTRHGIEFTSDYQNSPIQYIIETGQWLDTILSETTDRHFPILATLRAQGITHYVMAPLIFANRIVNAMSWATDDARRLHGSGCRTVSRFRHGIRPRSPSDGGPAESTASFLPPMLGAIRVRGSWRAPFSEATSATSRRQCCSPTCAVSADSPMSFRRRGSLSS